MDRKVKLLLDDFTVEQYYEMLAEHKYDGVIAQKLYVHPDTLIKWKKRMGLSTPRGKHGRLFGYEKVKQYNRLRKAGASFAEISRVLNSRVCNTWVQQMRERGHDVLD